MSTFGTVTYPFAELPQTLVNDMLEQNKELSRNLSESFTKIINEKKDIRKTLESIDYLHNESELDFDKKHPTTCGIDGSYIIDNLLSTDILAIAGVAVEGLSPPSNKIHWERPHHRSKILTIPHSDSSRQVASAIMMAMELELAAKAPHDIVFFDGSLSTPYVHFQKALNVLNSVPNYLQQEFERRFPEAVDNYLDLLRAYSHRLYVGVPKYTTKKEICKMFKLMNYEDRGLLSFILDEGEFIIPNKMDSNEIFIQTGSISLDQKLKDIRAILNSSHVIYYRPSNYFPVIRLEIIKEMANNLEAIAMLFETLKIQCNAPGMFEPFPLYLADRMVKHLRVALPALRKAATQTLTENWLGKVSNVYLAMHGYRSKWG